jgi:hypothetical protein
MNNIEQAIDAAVTELGTRLNGPIERRLATLVAAGIPLSELVVEVYPLHSDLTEDGILTVSQQFRVKLIDRGH